MKNDREVFFAIDEFTFFDLYYPPFTEFGEPFWIEWNKLLTPLFETRNS